MSQTAKATTMNEGKDKDNDNASYSKEATTKESFERERGPILDGITPVGLPRSNILKHKIG